MSQNAVTPGPIAREIHQLLSDALAPTVLEVVNDSAHHAGHMGDDGTGDRILPCGSRARPLSASRV
jgi:BolA protein